jgi:hypothetical protein
MSKGVLIYALNNEQIDYAKLALNAARKIKQHLGVPVALVTDSADWLSKQYPNYKDDVDIVIKVVQQDEVALWNLSWEYSVGSLAYYNGTIWCKVNEGPEIIRTINEDTDYKFNQEDFESVYQGIDIDKWYPNLPYLVGQHVWYKDKLYRCAIQYTEGDEFSIDKYISLIDNVQDGEFVKEISKGQIVLFNRSLWMSSIDRRKNEPVFEIRQDLWEDTRERFLVYDCAPQYRQYFDGAMTHKKLKFKNDIRVKSFELSPFDETLVIDCDYLINNNILKYCWEQPHDFLIHKKAVDLSGYRYDPRLITISDKSIDFYWATVFFFRKNKNTEIFFNYLSHVQENWNYYRYIYQIEQGLYRNDFAFSIAIHAMNGYQDGTWAHDLPGKLYYTIDKDILLEHTDTEMKFLIEKEKYRGEYTVMKTKGINVHVMNKFSINRLLNEELNV